MQGHAQIRGLGRLVFGLAAQTTEVLPMARTLETDLFCRGATHNLQKVLVALIAVEACSVSHLMWWVSCGALCRAAECEVPFVVPSLDVEAAFDTLRPAHATTYLEAHRATPTQMAALLREASRAGGRCLRKDSGGGQRGARRRGTTPSPAPSRPHAPESKASLNRSSNALPSCQDGACSLGSRNAAAG